ncbi:hypothetical protein NE474_01575 [Anaerostipes hadrus]|jgi:hypothetical protein|nr:hypothetical protein [Anaerostipes hadrus]
MSKIIPVYMAVYKPPFSFSTYKYHIGFGLAALGGSRIEKTV